MSQGFAKSALVAVIVVGTGCATASPLDRVVVFGDSDVDNGNRAALGASLGVTIDPPPNDGGRNNNGPVVVEQLAARPAGRPGVQRRHDGGRSRLRSHSRHAHADQRLPGGVGRRGRSGSGPRRLGRLERPLDLVDDTTLPAAQVPGAIATAIRNIDAGVAALSAAGATNIVVANRTPRDGPTSEDNRNGIAFDTALAADLSQLALGADLRLFDDDSRIADRSRTRRRTGSPMCCRPTCASTSRPARPTSAS